MQPRHASLEAACITTAMSRYDPEWQMDTPRICKVLYASAHAQQIAMHQISCMQVLRCSGRTGRGFCPFASQHTCNCSMSDVESLMMRPPLPRSVHACIVQGVLLDQFGVLHDGKKPYPGAIAAVQHMAEHGLKLFILSNSSRRNALHHPPPPPLPPPVAHIPQAGCTHEPVFDHSTFPSKVAKCIA